jgi:CubicO group peptidase (beta-lactamase class C family)
MAVKYKLGMRTPDHKSLEQEQDPTQDPAPATHGRTDTFLVTDMKISLVLVAAALGLAATPAAAAGLQDQLDDILAAHALFWNTSLSVAFAFDDPDAPSTAPPAVFAAAAGVNDRFGPTGDPITTASRLPSGSTDKAFTAAAVVRLAELGQIDLDAPAHTYIDPWLAAQSPPVESLLKQWGGDATINEVTVRQLLSMRSGIKDYDDGALFEWTLKHPDDDYLPQMFLSTVDKTFEFQPGQGGLYTGTGYVMLGMILSSVQNATAWDKVDQVGPLLSRSSTTTAKLALDDTLFMMAGKCSQYPEVTHQYIYNQRPYTYMLMSSAERQALRARESSAAAASCSGKSYPSTALEGSPGASFASESADACCASATSGAGPGAFWQYDGTNCTVFSQVYKGDHKSGYTAGQTDGPFDPHNVEDLYDYSCLNGWTMGNIATAPSDVVRFYSALANGRIVSAASLAEMRTYQDLTAGYEPPPGTPYGLGLLKQTIKMPLKGGAACTKNSQLCKCTFGFACKTHFESWGHPGLDWASGMPFLGVIPALNLSFALGFDSYEGFNSTMTYQENKNTYQYANTLCESMGAAVHHRIPDFPEFDCSSW